MALNEELGNHPAGRGAARADLDFDEDRSQIRTASGPPIMASLRNLAVTILPPVTAG